MVKIPRKIIAIIPARGGSKRIKNKNLVMLGGKPLLAHSILQAREARGVSRVIVSTEDKRIAATARKFGAEVVKRPKALAGDQASSEEALLHVLEELKKQEGYEPDLVVFLQCTSPMREPKDIEQAVKTLLAQKADSLFSACRNHGLIWEKRAEKLFSLNYDFRRRLREQKMPSQYRENGSIYVFRPEILRKFRNRLGGKIAVYEMDFLSSFQIDEPIDIKLIELLQPMVNNKI